MGCVVEHVQIYGVIKGAGGGVVGVAAQGNRLAMPKVGYKWFGTVTVTSMTDFAFIATIDEIAYSADSTEVKASARAVTDLRPSSKGLSMEERCWPAQVVMTFTPSTCKVTITGHGDPIVLSGTWVANPKSYYQVPAVVV
jgi:hypothetical protein